MKKSVCLFLGLLAAASAVRGQERRYVLVSEKPAGFSILADDLSAINKFTLSEGFTEAAVGPTGQFLYVLQNGLFDLDGHGLKRKGKLEVYDLASGKLLAAYELGWDSRGMVFSPDGKYLTCPSRGWQYTAKQTDPDGLLTVVDTNNQQVIARIPAGRLLAQASFTPDGSRLIALSSGRIYRKEPSRPDDYEMARACWKAPIKERQTIKARIQSFAVPDFHPLNSVMLEDAPHGFLARADGTLVAVDRGMAHRSRGRQAMGSVQVVDFGAEKVLARESTGAGALLTPDPADPSRFLVVSASNFNACRMQMTQWRDQRFARIPASGAQEGCPSSAVPASNGKRVLLSLTKSCFNWMGYPRNEIAIIDVGGGKIERIVKTGRRGVRVAKTVGAVVLVAAFMVPVMIVSAAMGSPVIKVPERIWVTPDGATGFVLDTDSDDVTILDVESGEVFGRVAVGGGPLGLVADPGGTGLLAVSRSQLTWIDPQAHKKDGQHSLENEFISAAFSDERGKRVVLLTDKGVLAWQGARPSAPQRVNAIRGGRLLLAVPQ